MRALCLFIAFLLLLPAASGHHILDSEPRSTDSLAVDIRANLERTTASVYNDADGDKVFDTLVDRFEATGATRLPVIVTFVEGTEVDTAMEEATRRGDFDVRYQYDAYGGFAADLSLQEVFAVAALPVVRQVEWSQPGEPELDTATEQMGVDAVQDLLGIDGSGILPDGLTGDGATIAILDTGFDGQHVDLQGKFIRFIDWSDGGAEKEPYDSGSHGTHVASIAAGLGVGDPKYKGVAPGADLVGFLISSSDTKGAAIASIDWILEHQNETPVDVLTISFGFGFTVDGTDALELAMDKAWEAGVTTFKSTGNSGPDRGTVTIPGGARGIIGTASLYDGGEGGFRLSSYSSRGPTEDGRTKPDIAAPGSSIMAADVGTGDGYTSKSGTSMASPFAAGVAGLLKSIDPTLSPDGIREALVTTAEDWGVSGHDVDYGNGRLDALAAVQHVLVNKAAREGLPYDQVAGWNVTGPAIAPHQNGIIDLPGGQGFGSIAERFMVADAATPVAVTFIANHSADLAVLSWYGFVADIEDPDGVVVASVDTSGIAALGLDPAGFQSRQQTVTLLPTMAGEYTLRVSQVAGIEQVLYDISAGLDVEAFDVPFPAAEAYEPAAPAPVESESTPAAPALFVVLALVGLAARRR